MEMYTKFIEQHLLEVITKPITLSGAHMNEEIVLVVLFKSN